MIECSVSVLSLNPSTTKMKLKTVKMIKDAGSMEVQTGFKGFQRSRKLHTNWVYWPETGHSTSQDSQVLVGRLQKWVRGWGEGWPWAWERGSHHPRPRANGLSGSRGQLSVSPSTDWQVPWPQEPRAEASTGERTLGQKGQNRTVKAQGQKAENFRGGWDEKLKLIKYI